MDKITDERKNLLRQHQDSKSMCAKLQNSLQASESKNRRLEEDLNLLREACKAQEKQAEELDKLANENDELLKRCRESELTSKNLEKSLQVSESKNQQLEKDLNSVKESCKVQEKQCEEIEELRNETKVLLKQKRDFELKCMSFEESLKVSKSKSQQLEKDLDLLKDTCYEQEQRDKNSTDEKKELLRQNQDFELNCKELEQSLQVSQKQNQQLENELSSVKEECKIQAEQVEELEILKNENMELQRQNEDSEKMCMDMEESLLASENKNQQLEKDLNLLKEACKMQEKQAEELESFNSDLIENQNEVIKSR